MVKHTIKEEIFDVALGMAAQTYRFSYLCKRLGLDPETTLNVMRTEYPDKKITINKRLDAFLTVAVIEHFVLELEKRIFEQVPKGTSRTKTQVNIHTLGFGKIKDKKLKNLIRELVFVYKR